MKKSKYNKRIAGNSNKGRLTMTFGPFIFGLLKHTFMRLLILPVYAFLAAPWLFIMLIATESGGVFQSTIFKIVATLSGQPNATSVDESDIALAIFVLFVIVSSLLEVYQYFKKYNHASRTGISNKRRLIIQTIITSVGWVIASVLFYSEMGIMGSLIALMFLVLSPLLFIPEYLFRETLELLQPKTTLH